LSAGLPEQLSFGGRVPRAVGLVLVLTVALSLVVAFGDRHAGSLFDRVSLEPAAVWRGEAWRVVTWAFVEPQPLRLIFGCYFLYWFGGDLGREWGSARFLRVFGALVLVPAIAICFVALADVYVMRAAYLGGLATGAGLTVAWGLWFPDRVVRLFLILPIRGIVLSWLTVAITFVYAVYAGWETVLPELVAEGAMLSWIYGDMFTSRWRKLRSGIDERRREATMRDRAEKRKKSEATLREFESLDDAIDLPPEVDRKLEELLRGRSKRDRSFDN
jgi:membrane associated rhomboid family serine protease